MRNRDSDDPEVVLVELPDALLTTRCEPRLATVLPLRLTSGSGETIPGVILNLSASGFLAIVDRRFSMVLPMPPGSELLAEFYLDEIEVRDAVITVERVKQQLNTLMLGCAFSAIDPELRTAIRARAAAAQAARSAREKG
jgi:hypothetical protein